MKKIIHKSVGITNCGIVTCIMRLSDVEMDVIRSEGERGKGGKVAEDRVEEIAE